MKTICKRVTISWEVSVSGIFAVVEPPERRMRRVIIAKD